MVGNYQCGRPDNTVSSATFLMNTIVRLEQTEQGTFGVFLIEGLIRAITMELPWRDNQVNISCIPEGVYQLKNRTFWGGSGNHGYTFEVQDVPGRTHILLHPANYASQLQGCIACGSRVEYLRVSQDNKRWLYNSGQTFRKVRDLLPDEFELCVISLIPRDS